MIWSRYGRALVRLDDGDAAGAVEDLMAFGEAARAGGYEDRQAPWRQWAALALAAAGDRPAALALADEQLRIASAWSPGAHGAALRVMALVGDPDQVEPCLARATELLIDTPLRLDHARALVDWGFALRRAQQRSRARTVLESGLELAARCGAGPLIERARTELIALGARPRRLMFSGVEALTATERRVADLAAQGLSNRAIARSQFVTEKTVESHLRSVYRKLDLSSRGQLKATLDAG
jgi:DNA-binding CsgD family transcriptional regulator